MQSYLQTYVLDAGITIIPLMFCLFLLVAGIVQAMIRLRRSRVLPEYLFEHATAAANKNDRVAYARDLKGQSSPLARALALALAELDLLAGHRPHRRHIEARAADAVAHVADDMYERIALFSHLYTVAPLLGLLGTVLGLVGSFQVFQSAADREMSQLGEGVAEALINTFWGLAIAIPAYVSAQAFQAKIRRYEHADLPESTVEIIESLYGEHPPAPEEKG